MNSIVEITAIANFLGVNMTPEQAEQLMDAARGLSIQDREHLYGACHDGLIMAPKFYTELTINRSEMRWNET